MPLFPLAVPSCPYREEGAYRGGGGKCTFSRFVLFVPRNPGCNNTGPGRPPTEASHPAGVSSVGNMGAEPEEAHCLHSTVAIHTLREASAHGLRVEKGPLPQQRVETVGPWLAQAPLRADSSQTWPGWRHCQRARTLGGGRRQWGVSFWLGP